MLVTNNNSHSNNNNCGCGYSLVPASETAKKGNGDDKQRPSHHTSSSYKKNPSHLFHKQDLGKAEEQNPQRLGILSERQKYNRTGFHSKNPCRKSNFITAGHLCHYDRYVCQLSITVSRNILLNQLEYILEPLEMRMLHLLINEVKLNVRIGHTIGIKKS